MSTYRKIYEQQYGEIPRGSDGRSYDIHHIDGDHSNDSPNNLKAVTIQEHYDIHYAQEDWGACQSIAVRMKANHEEIRELARKSAFQKVENKTHPWLRRPDGTSLTSDRVKDGTNPFLGGEIGGKASRQRVVAGTHNLLGGEQTRKNNAKLLKNGKHNFLGENNPSHKRLLDGIHNFIINHPNKNQPQITCPYCLKIGSRNNMKRYHYEKCKLKVNKELTII